MEGTPQRSTAKSSVSLARTQQGGGASCTTTVTISPEHGAGAATALELVPFRATTGHSHVTGWQGTFTDVLMDIGGDTLCATMQIRIMSHETI